MNTKKITQLFQADLKVINLGLTAFGENLREQEVRIVQMGWQPPAGGDPKLIALLEKLARLRSDTTR